MSRNEFEYSLFPNIPIIVIYVRDNKPDIHSYIKPIFNDKHSKQSI